METLSFSPTNNQKDKPTNRGGLTNGLATLLFPAYDSGSNRAFQTDFDENDGGGISQSNNSYAQHQRPEYNRGNSMPQVSSNTSSHSHNHRIHHDHRANDTRKLLDTSNPLINLDASGISGISPVKSGSSASGFTNSMSLAGFRLLDQNESGSLPRKKEKYEGTMVGENKFSIQDEDCDSNVSDSGDTDVFDRNVNLEDGFSVNGCPNDDDNDYPDDENINNGNKKDARNDTRDSEDEETMEDLQRLISGSDEEDETHVIQRKIVKVVSEEEGLEGVRTHELFTDVTALMEEQLQGEQQPEKEISTEDMTALVEKQLQDEQQPQKQISAEDASADPTSCNDSNDMNDLAESSNVESENIICLKPQEVEVEDDLALPILAEDEDECAVSAAKDAVLTNSLSSSLPNLLTKSDQNNSQPPKEKSPATTPLPLRESKSTDSRDQHTNSELCRNETANYDDEEDTLFSIPMTNSPETVPTASQTTDQAKYTSLSTLRGTSSSPPSHVHPPPPPRPHLSSPWRKGPHPKISPRPKSSNPMTCSSSPWQQAPPMRKASSFRTISPRKSSNTQSNHNSCTNSPSALTLPNVIYRGRCWKDPTNEDAASSIYFAEVNGDTMSPPTPDRSNKKQDIPDDNSAMDSDCAARIASQMSMRGTMRGLTLTSDEERKPGKLNGMLHASKSWDVTQSSNYCVPRSPGGRSAVSGVRRDGASIWNQRENGSNTGKNSKNSSSSNNNNNDSIYRQSRSNSIGDKVDNSGRPKHNNHQQQQGQMRYQQPPHSAQVHFQHSSQEKISKTGYKNTNNRSNNRNTLPKSGSKSARQTNPAATAAQMERDDAVDMLSCLVNHGLALQEQEGTISMKDHIGAFSPPSLLPHDVQTVVSELQEVSRFYDAHFLAAKTAKERKQLDISIDSDDAQESEFEATNEMVANDTNTVQSTHLTRMNLLDDLIRSYTYALEMKQASLSASSWLQAVGRSGRDTGSQPAYFPEEDFSKTQPCREELEQLLQEREARVQTLDFELCKCRAEIGRLKSVSNTRAEVLFMSPNRSILDDLNDDEDDDNDDDVPPQGISSKKNGQPGDGKVDDEGVAYKRMMVDSKREILVLKGALQKANELFQQLEEEKQQELETPGTEPESPGLDEKKDECGSKVGECQQPQSEKLDDQTKGGCYAAKSVAEEPFLNLDTTQHTMTSSGTTHNNMDVYETSLSNELQDYQEAISCADKAEIASLKRQLKSAEKSFQTRINTHQELNTNDERNDSKMIRVEMLNAENFVTDWSVDNLPPPPDHDLRSPIVNAVLNQWSPDPEARNEVLRWVERVLRTTSSNTRPSSEHKTNNDDELLSDDLNAMPPLEISNLDQETRDGFSMHILPLLLRRSDVHVEVTTRAHRRTEYDLVVRLSGKNSSMQSNRHLVEGRGYSLAPKANLATSKKHLMAFHASSTHSVVENEDGGLEATPSPRFLRRVRQERTATNNSTVVTSGVKSLTDLWKGGKVPFSRQAGAATEISNQADHGIHFEQDRRYYYPSGSVVNGDEDEISVHSSVTGASGLRSIPAPGSSDRIHNHASLSHHQRHQVTVAPQQSQSSIMGAIGGAFGLLSRKTKLTSPQKQPAETVVGSTSLTEDINNSSDGGWDHADNSKSTSSASPSNSTTNSAQNTAQYRYSPSLPPLTEQQSQHTTTTNNNNNNAQNNHQHTEHSHHPPQHTHPPRQSYHRVVSAPPGRIGVTFVDYRGHAMVSDVSPESPLQGWLFRSDVLIALDEVPVSGLRVRDVVKLLTARVERQRSLRVISNFDMNSELAGGQQSVEDI